MHDSSLRPASLPPTWRPWILFGLAAGLAILFYSVNSGIQCTNDGGHFALSISLAERGSAVLEDNARYAGHDIAVLDGRVFAGRDPGLGLVAWAFQEAFGWMSRLQLPLVLDPYGAARVDLLDRRQLGVAMWLPALLGSLLFLGVVRLLREVDIEDRVAIPLGVAFVTGTIVFRYASVLYTHILTASLICWAFALFISARSAASGGTRDRRLFIASSLLAYAVVVEPLVVVLFPAALSLLMSGRMREFVAGRDLWLFGLGGLGPFLILTSFNWTWFGHPFVGAYFHHVVGWQREFGTMFSLEQALTWTGKFLWSPAPFVSLGSSPLLWLGLCSLPLAALRRIGPGRVLWPLLGGFAAMLISAASYAEPWGGFDLDYRYVACATPLLAPFVALPLQLALRESSALLRGSAVFVYAAAAVASLVLQWDHVRHDRLPDMGATWLNGEAAIVNALPLLVLGALTTFLLSQRSRR